MKWTSWLFAALLFASVPAAAQVPPRFDQLLSGIDTVPSREMLDASCADARAELQAVALDPSRKLYERHRGITLLSFYPDDTTRAFLRGLLDNPDPEIRRMAVYTLGRTFGANADAELVAVIDGVIERDDLVVAQWAVRSLRWVAHENARFVLQRLVGSPNKGLRGLAAATLRKAVPIDATR